MTKFESIPQDITVRFWFQVCMSTVGLFSVQHRNRCLNPSQDRFFGKTLSPEQLHVWTRSTQRAYMAMQADTTDNKSRMTVKLTVFQGRQGAPWCICIAVLPVASLCCPSPPRLDLSFCAVLHLVLLPLGSQQTCCLPA